MKSIRLPLVVAIFIICCAGRCKNSENDFLTNLYSGAYKSYAPIKAAKEPLYNPLIGYWNLMDDRPLVISKLDETTYEFKFLSPYLHSDDIVYNAQVNTIAGSKYISMQSYKGNYMYFKIKPVDDDAITFLMLNENVTEIIGERSLSQFVAANPHLADTSRYYTRIALTRLTQEGAGEMQMRKIRETVQTIDDYEVYQQRFPADINLPEMKAKALDFSLHHCGSVDALVRIANNYPEAAADARKIAKQGCDKTSWCVDYVLAYPDDKAKDSIISIAFDRASGESDYKTILKHFPTHSRAGKITLDLALEENQNIQKGEKTQSEFELEYADIPSVIVLVNTIRIFDNFELNDNSFITNSYLLSDKGKEELDRVSGIISGVNKDNTVIDHLYISLRTNYDYGGENEEANFFQSANKCLAIKNYLSSKGLKDVDIHVIPLGMASSVTMIEKNKGKISIDRDFAAGWKKEFYDKCYALKQSDIIPDASSSSDLDHYLRVPEVEDYILKQFEAQIPLYKNKQAISRVIPPNYWNEEYKNVQPGFEEFHILLLQTAKKEHLKKKYIPYFVAG